MSTKKQKEKPRRDSTQIWYRPSSNRLYLFYPDGKLELGILGYGDDVFPSCFFPDVPEDFLSECGMEFIGNLED